MDKQAGVRIFIPLNKEYYLPSPWVQKGKHRSFEPVEGQPQFKLAEVVEIAVQKGQAIIDPSMCIADCYSATPVKNGEAANNKNGYSVGTGQAVEYDQIELKLSVADGSEEGIARIGLAPNNLNLGVFDGVPNVKGLTVGGDQGDKTLDVIGRLAHYGFLNLTKIHFEGGAEGFFATTPRFKTFSHTGQCLEDKRLHYPKATAEDDNTNIRTMTPEWLKSKNADLTLNGKNFLELTIPKDQNADITLYTMFYPKA
jgi:hypothetical protein